MTKNDLQLKQDVEDELRWDPKINAAQIGVTVDQGVVTLLGAVDTNAERSAAEDATRRVSGSRRVELDLTVKLLPEHARSDADIAAAARHALLWNVSVPGTIEVSVARGVVTLTGAVIWNYQRDAAERAIRNLTGVVSVINSVVLAPTPSPEAVREKIQTAWQRQASSEAQSLHITTEGGNVTLSGHLPSWQSIAEAEAAAWSAPGVTSVVAQLELAPPA